MQAYDKLPLDDAEPVRNAVRGTVKLPLFHPEIIHRLMFAGFRFLMLTRNNHNNGTFRNTINENASDLHVFPIDLKGRHTSSHDHRYVPSEATPYVTWAPDIAFTTVPDDLERCAIPYAPPSENPTDHCIPLATAALRYQKDSHVRSVGLSRVASGAWPGELYHCRDGSSTAVITHVFGRFEHDILAQAMVFSPGSPPVVRHYGSDGHYSTGVCIEDHNHDIIKPAGAMEDALATYKAINTIATNTEEQSS